jgi:precorrin-6B methylase 1
MFTVSAFTCSKTNICQVVITTYQTLNTDFVIPSDVDPEEEREWLFDNGFANSDVTVCEPV